jgi:hypothetical protein
MRKVIDYLQIYDDAYVLAIEENGEEKLLLAYGIDLYKELDDPVGGVIKEITDGMKTAKLSGVARKVKIGIVDNPEENSE